MIRAEPGLFGPVASDATVSRLITVLGADPDTVVKAIAMARKTTRLRGDWLETTPRLRVSTTLIR